MLKADDALALKRAKETQGRIREIALAINADVLYTSAVADLNIDKLKRCIIRRLDLNDEVAACKTTTSAPIVELTIEVSGIGTCNFFEIVPFVYRN